MNFTVSQAFINVCNEYHSIGCLNAYSEKILSNVKNKFYVPHYVDTSFFAPKPTARSGKLVVGFAASFRWHRRRKGAGLLSEIVKKLDSMQGFEFDARCVVDKQDGLPYTEMPGYYNDIDVLLSTSVEEGGPLSPLQAASCGIPTITTDCGSMPELINHGQNGFLVPCGLPMEAKLKDFIDKLELLKSSPDFLCNMKNNARNNVLLNWTTTKRVDQFANFYFNIQTNQKLTELYDQNITSTQFSMEKLGSDNKEAQKIAAFISPLENVNNPINTSWWEEEKPRGITFLIRARNEESTIGLCLDSLQQLKIPHEIHVFLNGCSDKTESEVLKRKNRGYPIKLFNYPCKMTRGGIEEFCTPVTSAHSSIWFWNWALTTSNFEYQCRWDADFIMTNVLSRELEEAIKERGNVYRIKTVYADSLKVNNEPYLFSKYKLPYFYKHTWWHATSFGVDVSIKQLNGSIVHDSSLSIVKSMWNDPPWWEDNSSGEILPRLAQDMKKTYNELITKLGPECKMARASDPMTDDAYNRFEKSFGTRIEDLEPILNKVKSLKDKFTK